MTLVASRKFAAIAAADSTAGLNHTVTSERLYLTGELTYADLDRHSSRTGGLVPVANPSDGRVHRRSERTRRKDAIWTRRARARRKDHAGGSCLRNAPARR